MTQKKISILRISLPDSSWQRIREIATHRKMCTDDTQKYSRERNRIIVEAIESLYQKEFPLDSGINQGKVVNTEPEISGDMKEIKILVSLVLSHLLRTKYLTAAVLNNIFDKDVAVIEANKAAKTTKSEWAMIASLIREGLESGADFESFRSNLFNSPEGLEERAKRAEANKIKAKNDEI